MKRRFLLAAAASVPWLAGCASPRVEDYAEQRPALDLRDYFNGTLDAWGVLTDRSGKVVRRFTVLMKCTWQGDEGVLDEAFSYSDGQTQRRVWRLKRQPGGRYSGTADDVTTPTDRSQRRMVDPPGAVPEGNRHDRRK